MCIETAIYVDEFMLTEDANEGLKAFIERRAAEWKERQSADGDSPSPPPAARRYNRDRRITAHDSRPDDWEASRGSAMGLRIAIVGAGAIGGTLGFLLAEAGYDVTLVDIDAAKVALLQEEGLTVIMPDGRERWR